MNWKSIKTIAPDAYDLAAGLSLPAAGISATYGLLDRHALYLVLTYERDTDNPWGYELHGPRFIREQCRYANRNAAEQAGMETAFEQLNKLVLAGNA
jgi:hypothetical protein